MLGGEKPERLTRTLGEEPVLEGGWHFAGVLEPTSGASMALDQHGWRAPGQLGDEHGAHEGVHGEPALDTDAVDEQAAGLGPLEKLTSVGSTGERIGEARIDAIDDRRLDHHVDDAGILVRQAPRARRSRRPTTRSRARWR